MKVGVRIMYKAIIIDDEPWTIIDIEKTFSLEDMGLLEDCAITCQNNGYAGQMILITK